MPTPIARLFMYAFVGILCAIGPLLLLFAIVSSIPTIQFVRSSVATGGEIIDMVPIRSSRHMGYVYVPEFRFIANDGAVHLKRVSSETAFSTFTSGDKVRILYLKDRPETARIDSISQLWMAQIILSVAGSFLSFFPFLIVKKKLSNRQNAATVMAP
jgi:hypothetical protein